MKKAISIQDAPTPVGSYSQAILQDDWMIISGQICIDPYTGMVSVVDVISQFKDDIVELIISETASLIAGDINEVNQHFRGSEQAERSN